ncbi:MAG: Uma2 family endonuclease, partial [Nitrospirota bacterium]|nr:Uma2 family endonuclease [Nitrospirota bacterium]
MALPERKRVYTYADYEKLPEGAPYQLIGGDLIKEPSPVPYHQILSKRIALELATFVEKNGRGEVL